MKVEIKYPTTKCKYCGTTFTKKHNRQMYCSDYCRTEAKKEQNRNSRLRYYYKNRQKEQYTTPGTRTIGPHPADTFEKEQKIIQNEKRRMGLS